MPNLPRFHLAFPVRDLSEARRFYGQLLGCREGRSAPQWVDFDFYGHQIVAHLCAPTPGPALTALAADPVPVGPFAAFFTLPNWDSVRPRRRAATADSIWEPQ